ncbi:MAG: glycosyltransferase family 2 protein [Solirubrobacteraceae bacterium]
MLRRSATLAAHVAGAWSLTANGYLLTLLAAAAGAPRGRKEQSIADDLFMIALVPAHDEQAGVATTVRALISQDYPAERREVVVIADNCSDQTAEKAREAGATVWERHDLDNRGKGQAVAWAIERMWSTWPDVDAIAVVDADCIATRGLLSGMVGELAAGACAVQADNLVDHPELSGAAARRWAGFALMHRVRGAGKTALGLSCGLFGTGMAFRADLLRELPWQSYSVTEDAEYHVRIVQSGRRVVFLPGESVRSAMPNSESGAYEQQMRWESGNASLIRRVLPGLIMGGLRNRDRQRLHTGLALLVPAQSLLAMLTVTTGALGLMVRDRRATTLAAAACAMQSAYVIGGLGIARAPAAVWLSLLAAPKLVAHKLIQGLAIARGKSSTVWVRTARDQS